MRTVAPRTNAPMRTNRCTNQNPIWPVAKTEKTNRSQKSETNIMYSLARNGCTMRLKNRCTTVKATKSLSIQIFLLVDLITHASSAFRPLLGFLGLFRISFTWHFSHNAYRHGWSGLSTFSHPWTLLLIIPTLMSGSPPSFR